jgi:hypothetical protein
VSSLLSMQNRSAIQDWQPQEHQSARSLVDTAVVASVQRPDPTPIRVALVPLVAAPAHLALVVDRASCDRAVQTRIKPPEHTATTRTLCKRQRKALRGGG